MKLNKRIVVVYIIKLVVYLNTNVTITDSEETIENMYKVRDCLKV